MFLSIKGIYYQAIVNGENVTWLTPYQFCHEVSSLTIINKCTVFERAFEGSKLQMVNITFEIFLVYHIRKYIDKNFSFAVLVLHMCTLEQQDYLTIITAFILKDKYLYVNLLAMYICALS